jgi:flagellar biogenesis protein FliO
MSLSAATAALLLTIATTAHGAEAVPGEVREEGVITTTTVVEAGEDKSEPHKTDVALYDRFFGIPEVESPPAQTPEVVEKTRDIAMPWWLIPVAMLGIGVLLLMRRRAGHSNVVLQGIRVVSRTHVGKEGSLAMIEVADGDHRTRRLLVGFGSGAPRLVADVSAWDVAVAAPSPVQADEPHAAVALPSLMDADMGAIAPLHEAPQDIPAFGRAMQAASVYSIAAAQKTEPEESLEVETSHDHLVAEVLAMRDASPLSAKQPPKRLTTSRRTVVA